MALIWVLRACLLRDYRTDRSYLPAFVMGVLGAVASLAVFFYLARLVDPAGLDDPAFEDGSYFDFVVIGLALFGILHVLLTSIPSRVRQDQLTGALEALFTTRATPFALALGYGVYDLLRAIVEAILFVLVAIVLFDLDVVLTWSGTLAATAALLLVVVLFAAVGVAAAGLVIAVKRVQAGISLSISVLSLLGTVYFPASLLPPGLETLAGLNPLTWALDVIRPAVEGGDVPESRLVLLAIVTAASVPAAGAAIDACVRRTKRQGTLNVY